MHRNKKKRLGTHNYRATYSCKPIHISIPIQWGPAACNIYG